MTNKKRLFLIVSLFLVVICFGLVTLGLKATDNNENEEYVVKSSEFFIDSALFTHKDDLQVYNQGEVNLDSFTLKLENSNLALYSNKTTGAIRILNKETGYYWCSDVYSIDDELTPVIKKKLTSSFRLLYRDKDGKVKEVYTGDNEVSLSEDVSGNKLTIKIKRKF